MHTRLINAAHGRTEATTRRVKNAFFRDPAVLKLETAHAHAFDSRRGVSVASLKAVILGENNEAGDTGRTRIGVGLCVDQKNVGKGSVSDPGLTAVKHPATIRADRPCLHSAEIATP